jgi:hypothetical protein
MLLAVRTLAGEHVIVGMTPDQDYRIIVNGTTVASAHAGAAGVIGFEIDTGELGSAPPWTVWVGRETTGAFAQNGCDAKRIDEVN